MKKKHSIKTIEDIKHCEEKGIELYDEYQATVCFRFVDGVWCSYTNKNLNAYNVKLSLNSLYYEEEHEEQQEATADDVGKLCKFYDTEADEPRYSVLEKVFKEDSDFPFMDSCCDTWEHCRPLSPAEVAEITGYKVEEN